MPMDMACMRVSVSEQHVNASLKYLNDDSRKADEAWLKAPDNLQLKEQREGVEFVTGDNPSVYKQT